MFKIQYNIFRTLQKKGIYLKFRRFSSIEVTNNLAKYLDIDNIKAEYLCLKYPSAGKLNDIQIEEIVTTIQELGYEKGEIINNPKIFGVLPQTLRYRSQALHEAGFSRVALKNILSYLSIIKVKSIKELKVMDFIPKHMNIENRLAGYMSEWPSSITTLITGNTDEYTLHFVRLKIIQRYLELVLDLTEDEFIRGIKTYPTIKHRPLKIINETLRILLTTIKYPNQKIKNNIFLLQADPSNLKQIIYKFRSIGGFDIKEILRLHPKIALRNYQLLVEIKQVLNEFGMDNEAQSRCFEIYTLSPETIRERLTQAKSIPEFQVLYKHPRFLKMIYYNNTAMERIRNLYSNNKKCLSLNILSGSTDRFKIFEKLPGDRLGKGKDLIFFLHESMNKKYSSADIRKLIQRHQFWINVPVVQVKTVFENLSKRFSHKDIYENCTILLYPWKKINKVLREVDYKCNKSKHSKNYMEQVDFSELNDSQILSLALYLLEQNHYFSGNGVWTEDQIKNVVEVTKYTIK